MNNINSVHASHIIGVPIQMSAAERQAAMQRFDDYHRARMAAEAAEEDSRS